MAIRSDFGSMTAISLRGRLLELPVSCSEIGSALIWTIGAFSLVHGGHKIGIGIKATDHLGHTRLYWFELRDVSRFFRCVPGSSCRNRVEICDTEGQIRGLRRFGTITAKSVCGGAFSLCNPIVLHDCRLFTILAAMKKKAL